MRHKTKKDILFFWSKVTFIALLTVIVIRSFFIESYSVSSLHMNPVLVEGDMVIVNKTAYGVRLPMTTLSFPFVFDSIYRFKGYNSSIQLPYFRIGECNIKRNDVVLFNNPSETGKPIDKRSLVVSRCIALPGEIVQLTIVSDKKNDDTIDTLSYAFEVPRKGLSIDITSKTLPVYQSIILAELGPFSKFENSQLLFAGHPQPSYTFTHDYFWMISDNNEKPLDSKVFGFVSAQHIIGKVRYIWFSKNEHGVQSTRCLTTIN